jgi:hypothetical protein
MNTLQASIATADLGQRMRERLGGAQAKAARVVWQERARQVLIHLDSLRHRAVDGWLVCSLDLQTDQAGRQTLQFVFFIGRKREGDGPQAGATINATTAQAAQLAEQWGAQVQRVLWDAVLDAIEAAVHRAGERKPKTELTLRGFHCANEALNVEVLTGAL